jgi:hypothetical protein
MNVEQPKGFYCRVERDSISPWGQRITTFVIKFPRIILAEVNTHREQSKNSASSRAIPFKTQVQMLREDPYIPSRLYVNQKGMQGTQEIPPHQVQEIAAEIRQDMEYAISRAQERQAKYNLHKQHDNRYLEPYSWCTQVTTGTHWANFLALRCHKDAQPEFREIANMMWEAYNLSEPRKLGFGELHAPFTDARTWFDAFLHLCEENEGFMFKHLENDGGLPPFHCIKSIKEVKEIVKMASAGRCARVSYLTHDRRRDLRADLGLACRLSSSQPAHMSPFEHIAWPTLNPYHRSGNFRGGWKQFRKTFTNEYIQSFAGYDRFCGEETNAAS